MASGSTPVRELRPHLFYVSGYRAAITVLANPRAFTARHFPDRPASTRPLLEQEPARHRPRRRIFATAIGGPHLAAARRYSRQRAGDLVRAAAEHETMDAMADVAEPLVRDVIAAIAGIDDWEAERVYSLVAAIRDDEMSAERPVPGLGAQLERVEFRDWVMAHIHGVAGSGALAVLASPDPVTGWTSTEDEVVVDARNLLQAGMGSTRLLIGNALVALLAAGSRPLHLDSALVHGIVEASLTRDPPNRFVHRTCLQPATVDGVRLVPGDELMVSLTEVNRDPSRGNAPHLAFGWGEHYCVGARLARAVAADALQAMADVLPDARLAPGFEAEHQPGLAGITRHGPRRVAIVTRPGAL